MESSLLEDSNLEDLVNEIVSMRLGVGDKGIYEALSALPSDQQPEELKLESRSRKIYRPNLTTLIENQHVANYKEFLTSFKQVKDEVDSLHTSLKDLNSINESIEKNLWVSKQNSRNLIEEIGKLEAERKKLSKERDLAAAYQKAFQLNTNDLKILRGTETSDILSEDFFAVFEKIQKIQSNVSVLMAIGNQTSAVEILDQMSLFQESALEKIYRWAQQHCKNVENPEIAEILKKGLKHLQIRPMLLKYVLDEYSTHRRSLVVRSFIDTLTGTGNTKGIEMIGSTDPSRYIGDMLAWIHQSFPTEKENLMILLKSCDKIDIEEKLSICLSTIMDGVCRPLNVRMEQTILSGLDCTVMNKIDIKIAFYENSIEKIIPGSNLHATLKELNMLCHQTFINQLKSQIGAELSEYCPPGPDLGPSSSISSLLSILGDLLKESSESVNSIPGTTEQMQILLNMIITPLTGQVCQVANRLGHPDSSIYICNCFSQIIFFLSQYPNTESYLTQLNGQIDSHIDLLCSEQSQWLIPQLGISHIYTILREKTETPLSTMPGMDPSNLQIFMNKMDSLIVDQESGLLPQCTMLNDAHVKKTILKQSFKILVVIYKQVYEAVEDPKNNYPKDLLQLHPDKLEEALCS